MNDKNSKRKVENITINELFREGGILSRGNSSYKERPQQIESAELINERLNCEGHVILEGPCGYGKSLAYLTPTIKRIYESVQCGGEENEKAVVVTSNISLQEQLIGKDIPFVVEKFTEEAGFKLSYSTLKGISNFICINKLELLTNDTTLIDLLSDKDKSEQEMIKEFAENSKTGDLNEIEFPISKELKNQIICSDSNDCENQKCSETNKMKCFYAKQKAKAKNSDIIVTNYHMLYAMKEVNSDVLDGSGIFIFDEVHEAEEILREFDTTEVKETSFEYISRQLKGMINKATEDYSGLFKDINMETLKEYAKVFFESVDKSYFQDDAQQIILIKNQTYFPDTDNIEIYMKKIIKGIAIFKQELESDPNLKKENADAINMARKLKKTCYKMLDIICKVDDVLEDKNKVIWIEKKEKNVIVGLKDVDVSSKFRSMFLGEGSRCILTSATISSNGNFDYLKKTLGLDELDKNLITEYLGETPFNLEEQELWYLPKNALPGNHKDFTEVSMKQIKDIIQATNGGVLALFTSVKNMKMCKEYLENEGLDKRILVQGEMSKGKILEEFKEDADSCLLATKSFFTGVDIQGTSLRCVVIDKLPFASPMDPVQQRLNEEKGAFFKHSLPSMIITLKQAVGRGVRTVNDKCVVCILDERIATSKYKSNIFRSFKYKKTATRDLDEVERFTRNYISKG